MPCSAPRFKCGMGPLGPHDALYNLVICLFVSFAITIYTFKNSRPTRAVFSYHASKNEGVFAWIQFICRFDRSKYSDPGYQCTGCILSLHTRSTMLAEAWRLGSSQFHDRRQSGYIKTTGISLPFTKFQRSRVCIHPVQRAQLKLSSATSRGHAVRKLGIRPRQRRTVLRCES